MKQIKRVIVITCIVFVGAVVLYHAAAGFACLYMTAPAITNEKNCDVIQENNGRKWCMNLLAEPKAKEL